MARHVSKTSVDDRFGVVGRQATRIHRLAGDWAFHRRWVARLLRREHVVCLGDSHAHVLRHVRSRGMWFRVKAIWGVTASGLPNPKSKTRSAEMFGRRLNRAKPWHQVLILLGEVDCGFVIWDRAKRRGLPVDDQLCMTLDAYQQFIDGVVARGFRRVMILSVPLPTIGDDRSEWGNVANLRGTITATQVERTALTLRFNKELRERCERSGALFVDTTIPTLDRETGLIQRRFVRDDQDHHLVDQPYAQVISEAVLKLPVM